MQKSLVLVPTMELYVPSFLKWTADTLIKVLYLAYHSGNPRNGFTVDQVFTDNVIKAKEIINIASWNYSKDTVHGHNTFWKTSLDEGLMKYRFLLTLPRNDTFKKIIW